MTTGPVYWTWRPFEEPDLFWAWAIDPHAELDLYADLDLCQARFLDRLVAAADREDCPNGDLCCRVLDELAPRLAADGSPDDRAALRAAVDRAGALPRTRRWADHARGVLGS